MGALEIIGAILGILGLCFVVLFVGIKRTNAEIFKEWYDTEFVPYCLQNGVTTTEIMHFNKESIEEIYFSIYGDPDTVLNIYYEENERKH